MEAENPKRTEIKTKRRWGTGLRDFPGVSQVGHDSQPPGGPWWMCQSPGSPRSMAWNTLERPLRRPEAGTWERPAILPGILGCSSASIISCRARNHVRLLNSQDKAAYNILVIFHPSIQSHTLSIYYHQLYCLFQCKQPHSAAFIFFSLSPGFQAGGALWKKWDFSQRETRLQAVHFR